MTLNEIKNAVLEGKTVCWGNRGYEVIYDGKEFLIKCIFNCTCIGLTWCDGVTLNGKEKDFFIA